MPQPVEHPLVLAVVVRIQTDTGKYEERFETSSSRLINRTILAEFVQLLHYIQDDLQRWGFLDLGELLLDIGPPRKIARQHYQRHFALMIGRLEFDVSHWITTRLLLRYKSLACVPLLKPFVSFPVSEKKRKYKKTLLLDQKRDALITPSS